MGLRIPICLPPIDGTTVNPIFVTTASPPAHRQALRSAMLQTVQLLHHLFDMHRSHGTVGVSPPHTTPRDGSEFDVVSPLFFPTPHTTTFNPRHYLYQRWCAAQTRALTSDLRYRGARTYRDYSGRPVHGPWFQWEFTGLFAWSRVKSHLCFLHYCIFFELLGRPPCCHTFSIDRIDGGRGYVMGNLRWATRKQQASNRSSCYVRTRDPTRHLWSPIEGYVPLELPQTQQHVHPRAPKQRPRPSTHRRNRRPPRNHPRSPKRKPNSSHPPLSWPHPRAGNHP